MLNAIYRIRSASLKALWTDANEAFPTDDDEIFLWEVWLPVRNSRDEVINKFRQLAGGIGFEVSTNYLEFPERTVLLARTSKSEMSR